MLPKEIISLIYSEQKRQQENFIKGISIDNYISKIEKNAELICHFDAGECVGFVAYYCNDPARKNAFVTLVLISPKARGKGIAKSLMRAVLYTMSARGFEKCSLEVKKDNTDALNLYGKLGFIDAGESHGICKMILTLQG